MPVSCRWRFCLCARPLAGSFRPTCRPSVTPLPIGPASGSTSGLLSLRGWQLARRTEIPASDPDVGGFRLLFHTLDDQLLELIRASADSEHTRDPLQQQVSGVSIGRRWIRNSSNTSYNPSPATSWPSTKQRAQKVLGKLAAQLQLRLWLVAIAQCSVGPDQKQFDERAVSRYRRARSESGRVRQAGRPTHSRTLPGLHRGMFRTLGSWSRPAPLFPAPSSISKLLNWPPRN